MAVRVNTTVLRWPMELDSSGRFVLCSDLFEAWDQRVRALLTTRLGERVMRSDYGCSLVDALFDPVGAMSPEQEVRQAMTKWLPRLTVLNVDVITEESEVSVHVTYKTPDGTVSEVVHAFMFSGGSQ